MREVQSAPSPAQASPSPRRASTVAALLLALLCLALPARAADPRYSWETLDTPHFEVHYHQGGYPLALRLARLAEEAHRRLTPLLDHRPEQRCQIVLIDDSDFANGSATPVYYNLITANAAPPSPRSTLAEFDDWVWELISHEYTHILHLDTVKGLPQVVDQLFGKLWIPNGGQPTWFIEGLAVLSESRLSAGGRLRSSLEELQARALAAEGRFPSIDQISNATLQWPRGGLPYLLGGRFLAFVEERYGAGALRDLSHDFGGRAIPFSLNLSAERVLGRSWIDLWADYAAQEEAAARASLEALREAGETRVEQLTALGESTRSPRFSRDGRQVYYTHAGPDRRPELRVAPLGPCCSAGKKPSRPTPAGDVRLREAEGDPSLAVAPDGALVYSRPQVFQQFETAEDLYRLDPRTGSETRLTRGLRASEPDVGPDGAIAFVQRLPGGRTAIALLEPGAEVPRTLYEDALGPVASPRFSPSGNAVVFVRHAEAWNLALAPREGGQVLALTSGRALDRDPSFSPGGAWVLFSSDRESETGGSGGSFDAWALRLADRRLVRLTRAAGGALEPALSPDGTQLLFLTTGAGGTDLARVPIDAAALSAAPAAAPIESPPAEPPAGPPAARPPATLARSDELFPSRPYQPLATLGPRWWLPYLAGDAAGAVAGVLTSGSDAAGRYDWAAAAFWGIDGHQPGWDLRFTSHTLYPDLTVYSSRDLVSPPGVPDATERQVQLGASASFPFSAWERALSLGVGFGAVRYASNQAPGGVHPADGTATIASFQLSYSDARRYPRSISPEEGQQLQLSLFVADPALGGDFAFRQLTFALTRYLALPFSWNGRPLHHALALRLAGGVARGDQSERHLFTLGGFASTDWTRALVNPQAAQVRTLRGYQRSAFSGEAYLLTTLEYRLPIADLERGPWTLPIYFRRLHGALFADAGDAFTLRQHDFSLHASAGVELRTELVLGWSFVTDLRLGCARGLSRGPEAILDCYGALGGIF